LDEKKRKKNENVTFKEEGHEKGKKRKTVRVKEKADANSHDKAEFYASRCPNKNHYVEYRSGAKGLL